jgi:hypothetical protein
MAKPMSYRTINIPNQPTSLPSSPVIGRHDSAFHPLHDAVVVISQVSLELFAASCLWGDHMHRLVLTLGLRRVICMSYAAA